MPFDDRTAIEYLSQVVSGKDKGHPLKSTKDFNDPGWREITIEADRHKLGKYPEILLDVNHPNQSEEWRDWSKSVFQPITKPSYNKAVKHFSAVVTETNFEIFWPDDTDDIIGDGNYLQWLRDSYLNDAFARDSNAVCLRFPPSEMIRAGDEEIEQINVSNTYGWIIENKQIHDKNVDWLCFLDYAVSPMEGTTLPGKIWWLVDTKRFYRFTQITPGDSRIENYELEVYFEHGAGSKVWEDIGGIKEKRGDFYLYRVYYEAFFPFANDALIGYADAKINAKVAAHPVPIIKAMPCNACHGHTDRFKHEENFCQVCEGTGETVRFTYPGEGIVVKPQMGAQDEAYANTKPLEWIKPPSEDIKALDDRWKHQLEEAEKSLNQKMVLQPQSGIAKDLDREDLRTDIAGVGQIVWGRFVPNDIDNDLKIKYGADWQRHSPMIRPPTEYKIKSSAEYLDEIKMGNEAKLPSALQEAAIRGFIASRYANNPSLKKELTIAALLDPLFSQDVDDLPTLRNTGGATDEDIFRSKRASFFIRMLIEEQGSEILDNPLRWWMGQFDSWVYENMVQPEPIPNPFME